MTAPARTARSFVATPVAAPAYQPIHQPIHRDRPPEPTAKRRRQTWLALHFHGWALHAALDKLPPTQRSSLQTQPVAVLDFDRQRRVLACNAAAWRQGIRAGHTLNAAIALCKETQFLEREPAREAQLLECMAAWAQQYTPAVSIEAPNELLLEVRGSLRLFGGAAALAAKLSEALRARDISVGLAMSATARSALWLARGSAQPCIVPPRELKARLAGLPVACLQWPAPVALRLSRFGVLTLADVWRLPRADLARRIGAECMRELHCALGRRQEIRTLFQPPEPYADRIILDFEIATTALLEPLLFERLQVLQRYLRERDATLDAVGITLQHREHASTSLCLALAALTADMDHVATLLHERLASLTLQSPVIGVRLQVRRLYPAQGRSLNLFHASAPGAAHLTREQKQARLLEQLRARLGEQAIRALCAQADHRPEKAQSTLQAEVASRAQSLAPLAMPKRPLWLLREPRGLGAGAQLPDEMYFVQGPERIESGWWDGTPVHRDYYLAKHCSGALCWIFREHAPPGAWYLHGLFG